MVPEDWKLSTINDVGSVITGSTPKTLDQTLYDGPVPFVSPADLGTGRPVTSTIKTLTEKGFAATRRIRKGSTLFTCIGSTIGKIGFAGVDLATNQQINSVVPNSSHDDAFIYYALALRARHIAMLAGKQAVPIINKSMFSDQPILLPPLPEQKKIAQILSTWDQAITATERLLENSQKRKKALMQQLLTGKKRLPGFEGEWQTFLLGHVFEKVSNGVTYDATNTDGLPVTRIETISTGKVNFNKVGWAPDTENTRRFILKRGDILYSHINSLEHIGRVAYFNNEETLYHGMNLLLLRVNEGYCSKFFFHLLNSPIGKKYSKNYAKSAVNQASISTTDIKTFKVNVPPLEEQRAIAITLSKADQEITALERKVCSLEIEKKALMQQLLTGKRRVNVDTEAA